MEKFTFNANADLVQQVTNFYNVADISENVEVVFNSPFDREKLPMIFQEFRRQNGLINGFCCDDSQGICYLTTSIGKLHTVDYDIEEIIEAIDLYCKEKPIIKFDISVEELAGEEANISKIQDYAFDYFQLPLKKENVIGYCRFMPMDNLKRKIAVINKAITKHHLNKEDIIYIGDEIDDYTACKTVGIKFKKTDWQ